jgi:chloramphenicol O-acetyltransferase type A
MDDKATPGAVQIDLQTWERTPLYELFTGFSEPYHGVCLRVDCTGTYRHAKKHGISIFLALVHGSLTAANQVENFTTRIVDGAVWRYPTIHGGSAVGRPNGTIGFGHYPYHPDLISFVREASLELERVKSRNDLERYSRIAVVRLYLDLSRQEPRRTGLRAEDYLREDHRGRRALHHATLHPCAPRARGRTARSTVRRVF